jgi:CheY-like chemotaxis protein
MTPTTGKRVLVVEDDPNKARLLAQYVRDRWPKVELTERHSFQSGLSELLVSEYDVALVDMAMPTHDAGAQKKPRHYAGRDILREVVRAGRRAKIVIVTQFETFGEGKDAMTLEQLRAQLRVDYPQAYIGTVFYQPAELGWQAEIWALVSPLLKDAE